MKLYGIFGGKFSHCIIELRAYVCIREPGALVVTETCNESISKTRRAFPFTVDIILDHSNVIAELESCISFTKSPAVLKLCASARCRYV